jgi:hypothetical protein
MPVFIHVRKMTCWRIWMVSNQIKMDICQFHSTSCVTTHVLNSCNRTLLVNEVKSWIEFQDFNQNLFNSKSRSDFQLSFEIRWPLVKVFNTKVAPNILICIKTKVSYFSKVTKYSSRIYINFCVDWKFVSENWNLLFLNGPDLPTRSNPLSSIHTHTAWTHRLATVSFSKSAGVLHCAPALSSHSLTMNATSTAPNNATQASSIAPLSCPGTTFCIVPAARTRLPIVVACWAAAARWTAPRCRTQPAGSWQGPSRPARPPRHTALLTQSPSHYLSCRAHNGHRDGVHPCRTSNPLPTDRVALGCASIKGAAHASRPSPHRCFSLSVSAAASRRQPHSSAFLHRA